MPLLISVDLGTSTVKAFLVDATTGTILAAASRPALLYQPHPGIAEQDPDQYLAAAHQCMRAVLDTAQVRPASVAAVALDSQMSGCLGIDRDGQAITRWTQTLDMRFTPYVERFLAKRERDICRVTGSRQPCFGPKIAWLQAEYPELAQRVAKYATLGGYVAGRMAGLQAQDAFVDTTYAPVTGIMDAGRGTWSGDLCGSLNIPMEKLPRIVRSTEVIGTLSPESAQHSGLLSGTPVVAGCGDQAAGFLGAGLIEPGMLIDVAGTYAVFALCADRFLPDLDGRVVEVWPSALPGLWHPLTFVIGLGLTHRWFLDLTGARQGSEAGPQADGFAALDARAALLPPGSEGALFVPHLGGRACPPDTTMRGSWLGLNWGHGRHHLYRSILEAGAYEHALGLQAMRRLYTDQRSDQILVTGGGARGALWNQIKADVLGLPYQRLQPDATAALGTALLAGNGAGLFTDWPEPARRWSRAVERTMPDLARYERYQPLIRFYEQVLAQISPLYRR